MPSELKVNKLSPYTGSTLTIGDSGDTIAITSGASLTGFTSTGIDDNATNTAITIDSSQNVGIGTTSPSTALDVDGTVTATQFVGGGLNAYRNLIINGDMNIAQRGTSQATAGSSGGSYQTLDRYDFFNNNLGAFTWSQDTDVPTGQGFANSMKFDCTTADAAPAAGDYLFFAQYVEAQNCQYLKYGTSNAESLTLSFWVKSNKTGTYCTDLRTLDPSPNRLIGNTYTIDTANTWEKKTITFVGDTVGTINNDNGRGIQVSFFLGSGSDFSSGTLQTSWGTFNNANRAVGQVNLADSASNEWYITGVQLEAGTSASDFEFLPYDVNLRRCQRYLQKFTCADSTFNVFGTGIKTGATSVEIPVPLKTTMRAKPSLSSSGLRYRDATGIDSSITIGGTYTDRDFPMLQLSNSTATDSAGYLQGASSSDFLQFDAEL